MSNLDKLLSSLDNVKRIGNDRYKSICPAHDDHTPTLYISGNDGKLLLKCFAGCENSDIVAAIGLTLADLMPDKSGGNFKKVKKPFYAMDILGIIKFEATLVYIHANDIANGLILTIKDKERLLLAASRINHAFEVAKNGI